MGVNISEFNLYAIAMLSYYENNNAPDIFSHEMKEYIESDKASLEERKTYSVLNDLFYNDNKSNATASFLFDKLTEILKCSESEFDRKIVALIVCHDTNRHDEEEKLLQWLSGLSDLSESEEKISDLVNDYIFTKMSEDGKAVTKQTIMEILFPPYPYKYRY